MNLEKTTKDENDETNQLSAVLTKISWAGQ